MGRPSDYTEELALAFCARLAEVGAVTKVCADEGMPARSTLYQWLRKEPGFVAMYQAAREEYADAEFEALETLMNEQPPADMDPKLRMAWVQDKRLRVDTVKWRLGKLSRRYAERMELTGAEGSPLIPSDELTEERRIQGVRRIAFLLQKADIEERDRRQPLLLTHDVKAPANRPEVPQEDAPPAHPPAPAWEPTPEEPDWSDDSLGSAAEHGFYVPPGPRRR